MEHEIRNYLQVELLAAAVRALEAKDRFEATTREIPGDFPRSDGAQSIRNALREVNASRVELMRAHKRVVAFIEHRIVPEDLKPKG